MNIKLHRPFFYLCKNTKVHRDISARKNLYLFLHFSLSHLQEMNYLDIIIGLILILSAFRGLKKGLIAELTSFGSNHIWYFGSDQFFSHISDDFLMKHFNLESGNLNIVSFITTFIVIVILVHIVGNL